MFQTIQKILLWTGGVLFFVGGVRVYRLVRGHEGNLHFAPQLLAATLSLWIASVIFRIGRKNETLILRDAIALIRSGSLLMMIWGYRLFLLLKMNGPNLFLSALFAWTYLIFGGGVMVLGLKISRSLRRSSSTGLGEKTL